MKQNLCVQSTCADRTYVHLTLFYVCVQLGQEKEELEPWLVKEMDQLVSDVWLTGSEDIFSQIFHLITSENISGQYSDDHVHSGQSVMSTVVSLSCLQWSVCHVHSGQSVMSTVVSLSCAQWSVCHVHSGQSVMSTVVSLSCAQWSVCLVHSGQSVMCTVVSLSCAQWSVCHVHSGQSVMCTVVSL